MKYHISLWGADPICSFSPNIPQVYTTRRLATGTVDPMSGEGDFVFDDYMFSKISGRSSINSGVNTIQFTTGRDAIVVMGVQSDIAPILPSAFTNSSGLLYTTASNPGMWLQGIFEAVSPQAIGLHKQDPVASAFYAPANTQLQLGKPSMLPNLLHIVVYKNPTVQGGFVTYLLSAEAKAEETKKTKLRKI